MSMRREWTPEDYLAILSRRRRLIIILAILGAICGSLVASALPRKYTSHTTILVEQPTVPDSYVKPVVSEDLNQRLASMKEQILSRTRLQHLIEQFGLYGNDVKRVPMEDLVERLRQSVMVTPLSPMAGTRSLELPGFSVDVTTAEAQLAQRICTQITSMFIEQDLEVRQRQTEDTAQFLARQLEEAKIKLDDQDARLAGFQRRYIGGLPEDEKTNLTLLMGMTPRLEAATQALNQAQQDKAFTESLLSQQLSTSGASKEGKDPQNPKQRLNDLENQLAALRARYTERHPDILRVKNDIAELQRKVADASADDEAQPNHSQQGDRAAINEPPEVRQLRARLQQIDLTFLQRAREREEFQQQIKVLESKIQSSPVIQQEFKALTRDYQTALNFYNDLLKKRNESQMATELEHRQQGEQFRVLDPPTLPERPSFPKRRLFALGGLFVGLVSGFAMATILEFRGKSIWTKEDVEFYLRVPTLALIPSADVAAGKTKASLKSMAALQSVLTRLRAAGRRRL